MYLYIDTWLYLGEFQQNQFLVLCYYCCCCFCKTVRGISHRSIWNIQRYNINHILLHRDIYVIGGIYHACICIGYCLLCIAIGYRLSPIVYQKLTPSFSICTQHVFIT